MPFKYECMADRLAANSREIPEGWNGTPCRLWTGATSGNGDYGKLSFRFGGKLLSLAAHLVAYAVHHGRPIREGYVGAHACDRSLCINGAHIEERRQTTNIRDCVARGRHFTPFRRAA